MIVKELVEFYRNLITELHSISMNTNHIQIQSDRKIDRL